MYTDPTKLRNNVVKVRLSDEEMALVDAVVNYNGGQKAALLREMILEQAAAVLGIDATAQAAAMSAPYAGHLRA